MAGVPSGGLFAPPPQPGGLFGPFRPSGGLFGGTGASGSYHTSGPFRGDGASGSWAPEPTFWEKLQEGMRDAVALPGKVLDKPSEGVKRHFGYEQKRAEAEHYVELFAIPEKRGTASPENAFYHAYVSAALAYNWNEHIARSLGIARETNSLIFQDTPDFLVKHRDWAELGARSRDSNRDFYNNEIGFQIGEFAKANGLPYEDIPYLVAHALRRGVLITDEMNDPRNGVLRPSFPEEWQPPDEALQRGF